MTQTYEDLKAWGKSHCRSKRSKHSFAMLLSLALRKAGEYVYGVANVEPQTYLLANGSKVHIGYDDGLDISCFAFDECANITFEEVQRILDKEY
jgi:hypothetical protein